MSSKIGPASKASTDLRARRTRKWLQAALIELMAEKPYREIQITEIADRAQVSRPAFYLHFRSKEELLLSHVDNVFEAFQAALEHDIAQGHIDRRAFCVMLFEYWAEHAATLRMVIAADVQDELLGRIRAYFDSAAASLARHRGAPSKQGARRDYEIDFAAGGAYMLLTHWIASDMQQPVEEMGGLLAELAVACV